MLLKTWDVLMPTIVNKPAIPMDGAELRARRMELGVTQEGLGVRLGVSWNTIARWERGDANILHPMMLRLALERLELEHHLTTGKPVKPYDPSEPFVELSPGGRPKQK